MFSVLAPCLTQIDKLPLYTHPPRDIGGFSLRNLVILLRIDFSFFWRYASLLIIDPQKMQSAVSTSSAFGVHERIRTDIALIESQVS